MRILKLQMHCSQELEDVIRLLNQKVKECQSNKVSLQAQVNSNFVNNLAKLWKLTIRMKVEGLQFIDPQS